MLPVIMSLAKHIEGLSFCLISMMIENRQLYLSVLSGSLSVFCKDVSVSVSVNCTEMENGPSTLKLLADKS